MNGVQLKPQNEGCFSGSAESIEEKLCKFKSSRVEALREEKLFIDKN